MSPLYIHSLPMVEYCDARYTVVRICMYMYVHVCICMWCTVTTASIAFHIIFIAVILFELPVCNHYYQSDDLLLAYMRMCLALQVVEHSRNERTRAGRLVVDPTYAVSTVRYSMRRCPDSMYWTTRKCLCHFRLTVMDSEFIIWCSTSINHCYYTSVITSDVDE